MFSLLHLSTTACYAGEYLHIFIVLKCEPEVLLVKLMYSGLSITLLSLLFLKSNCRLNLGRGSVKSGIRGIFLEV